MTLQKIKTSRQVCEKIHITAKFCETHLICRGTICHPFQSFTENVEKQDSFASLLSEMKSDTCYFSFVSFLRFPYSPVHWYPIFSHPQLEKNDWAKV